MDPSCLDHLTDTPDEFVGRKEQGEGNEDRESRERRKKRCLFYGHYDCIAAEGSWTSDPFTLDGRDGYL